MFEPIRRPWSKSDVRDWPKDSLWTEPTIYNLPPNSKAGAMEVIPFLVLAIVCVGGIAVDDARRLVFVALGLLIFVYIAWRNWVTGRHFWGGRKKGKRYGDFIPELLNDSIVNLSIYVDSRMVGRDQGVLAFEDDALYFAGNSSSFLIGVQDIDLEYSFEKLWKSNVAVPDGGFLIRVRHPRAKLELVAIHTKYLNQTYTLMNPEAIQIHTSIKQSKPTRKPRSFPPITKPAVFVSE